MMPPIPPAASTALNVLDDDDGPLIPALDGVVVCPADEDDAVLVPYAVLAATLLA